MPTRSACRTAPVQIRDRATGRVMDEVILGNGLLRWAYGSAVGKLAVEAAIKRAVLSRLAGWRMRLSSSRRMIAPFIARHGIDMTESVLPADAFPNFNAFFERALAPTTRPVPADPAIAVLPCDGRHLVVPDLSQATRLFAKDQMLNLAALLGDSDLAASFHGGCAVCSRLSPVDYHRFHFPVDGLPGTTRSLPGPLYSVSPPALRQRLAILWTNRRHVTVIASPMHGAVAMVEIGATFVGSVRQTHQEGAPARRGAEKGLFALGGSYIITLFARNRFIPDPDLVAASAAGFETLAKMGESAGHAPPPH